MKVPLSWLADLTEVPDGVDELAERLTSAGLECEVLRGPEIPARIVTGKIVTCEKHPNADRLSVCRVDVGEDELYDIICGAPNAEAGWVAAAALPGADFGGGFVIAKRKLRGVTSNGMLCSEKELGLSEESDGILLLPPETEIGLPLGEVLANEPALITEPTSNRGDLMSVEGVAREIAATAGRSLELRKPEVSVGKGKAWSVEIDVPQDCPRYCGRVLEGLTTGPSPKWMADRLAAAGIRPLWNLVDVTNYVLLELGHPMHAFDLEKLSGNVIGVRLAEKGERVTTLDGKDRELGPETLLITDGSGPVAIGGIMGGESTMVTESTTSMFLEAASFEPSRVRAGVRALKLITDASGRFERGVDPESIPRAIDRCCELLLELCPGARVVEKVDAYPEKVRPARVKLRRSTLERVLGVQIPDGSVRAILESLELAVKKETKAGWEVAVPTWRRDVTAEEDLVEEVARIHGYDRIPERAIARISQRPLRHPRVLNFFRARTTLLRLGLDEAITPTLVDGAFEDPLVDPEFFGGGVPLRNPLTADRSHLRSSLLPSLLRVLTTNRAHSVSDLAIYEIGRTFSGSAETQVTERQHVAILLAGLGLDRVRGTGAKSCDFFDIKGLLEVYVEQFWERRLRVEGSAPAPFSPDRSAGIYVDDERVGYLGEIGQEARKAFDLPPDEPVFLAELDVEADVGSVSETRFFEPLPRHPGVVRDLAFVVPRTCRHDALESALRKEAGELLAELRLFDVYEGAPLDEREKSLAYTLVFRSPDRSLTHDEVDGCVEALVKQVGQQLNARLR